MIVNDSVALVTGGASGLGLATVKALLADGAQVVIVDLPSSDGETVAKELGDRVRFAAADVTDEAAGHGGARPAPSRSARCASRSTAPASATPSKTVGKKGAFPLDAFKKVVEVNLIGTFNVIRLAAERSSPRREPVDGERGVIVNTASVAAFDGQIGQAAYSASKGGIVGMTLPIARDLALAPHPRHHHRARACSRPRCSALCRRRRKRRSASRSRIPRASATPTEYARSRSAHRRQPDAQRRGHPARRRHPHGAALNLAEEPAGRISMFDLTGTRALVTGGSAGLGLGMARGLARAGADIALWGRDSAKLGRAADELRGFGVRVTTRSVDVSDEHAVVDGVASVVGEFGGLDTVVVNAGIGAALQKFHESSTEQYRKVMGTNAEGAYFTLRETSKVLVDQGTGGSVIVTSSLGALQGAGRNQAYGASKAAVLALANGCAVELARYGIRVNSVLPGWIATDMTGPLQDSDVFNRNVISRVPLGRWGRPEDFEGIAVYLASDASAFQTGSATVIDGGYSMF